VEKNSLTKGHLVTIEKQNADVLWLCLASLEFQSKKEHETARGWKEAYQ